MSSPQRRRPNASGSFRERSSEEQGFSLIGNPRGHFDHRHPGGGNRVPLFLGQRASRGAGLGRQVQRTQTWSRYSSLYFDERKSYRRDKSDEDDRGGSRSGTPGQGRADCSRRHLYCISPTRSRTRSSRSRRRGRALECAAATSRMTAAVRATASDATRAPGTTDAWRAGPDRIALPLASDHRTAADIALAAALGAAWQLRNVVVYRLPPADSRSCARRPAVLVNSTIAPPTATTSRVISWMACGEACRRSAQPLGVSPRSSWSRRSRGRAQRRGSRASTPTCCSSCRSSTALIALGAIDLDLKLLPNRIVYPLAAWGRRRPCS